MDFKYVTNISHLFSKDPKAEMPDELLKFRNYLGHVIRAATVTNEIDFLSAIPCRKKPSRKPCTGFLKVTKQDLPVSYIYWHCSACDDCGRIANWRGCCYDQSCFNPSLAADNEPNPLVEVEVSRDEMNALLQGSIYDPDSERIIYSARPSKTAVLFKGLYGDMDNFVEFLAADVNHEENKKRQRLLDRVYEKVSDAVQAVYDESGLGLG